MKWKRLKLSEVCTLQNGRAYKKAELLSEGKYPVLRVGNFFTSNRWYYSNLDLNENKYCKNGDLLYAWSASFGAQIWQGEKSIYHYHIWRIDLNEKLIDKKFLYYWLEFDKENLKKKSGTGTTMMHVSKSSMEKREILIPSLSEQKHIATNLDAVFSEIDNRIFLIKNKKKHLNSLKDKILTNQLRLNLEEKKLSEVCKIYNGGTPDTKNKLYWNGNNQWLTPRDMGKLSNEYIDTTLRQLSEDGLKNSSANLVPKNSVILSSRAPIGHLAINKVPMAFNQGCKGLVPNSLLIYRYLYYFLLSSKKFLNEIGTGTTFKEISSKTLSSVKINVPSQNLQKAIVKKLDIFFDNLKIIEDINNKQIKNYTILKSSILSKKIISEVA